MKRIREGLKNSIDNSGPKIKVEPNKSKDTVDPQQDTASEPKEKKTTPPEQDVLINAMAARRRYIELDDDDDAETTVSANEQKARKPDDDHRQTTIENGQIPPSSSEIPDKPGNTNSKSAHTDLLSEIRKGKKLNKVTDHKIEQVNPNTSKETTLANRIAEKTSAKEEVQNSQKYNPIDEDEWK